MIDMIRIISVKLKIQGAQVVEKAKMARLVTSAVKNNALSKRIAMLLSGTIVAIIGSACS